MKILSIKPVFTKIITTAEKFESDQTIGSIIDASKTEGRYKDYQKVVKVGSSVREVKEGDLVLIDPSRYIRKKYSEDSIRNDFDKNPIVEINIPTVEMGGKDYFMIDERDIAYIIDDFEEESAIIKPRKPKLEI